MSLSVAPRWYGTERLDARTWRLTEPHVHPIYAANIYLVLGKNADLLVDSGMGVAPLRPVVDALRPDPAKPLILFTTHCHVDHMGAAHEFDHVLVHPLERDELVAPAPNSLDTSGIEDAFRQIFLKAGYPPLWPLLIDALPYEGYDPGAYALKGTEPTATVTEGEVLDFGDWQAEVLHLPGHSPGQVGLWDKQSGTLFSADAIYDGPLLYEGAGTDVSAYADTLRRLRTLPVDRVLGGHEGPIGRDRCRQIADQYLKLWGT